jgi:predicted ATPase/class 3 adenylate cyclase
MLFSVIPEDGVETLRDILHDRIKGSGKKIKDIAAAAGQDIAPNYISQLLHKDFNYDTDKVTRILQATGMDAKAAKQMLTDIQSVTKKVSDSEITDRTRNVAFLQADIEGSTRLWETYPEEMHKALRHYSDLMRNIIENEDGYDITFFGDIFCAVFSNPVNAVQASISAQRVLQTENWGEIGALRVRMAIHYGIVSARDGEYFGPPLNRCARLLGIGHGGQILLSQAVAYLVENSLPRDVNLHYIGPHSLRDLFQPEHVYQVECPDLPIGFPPLRSIQNLSNNLPKQATSFIGRHKEIDEIIQWLQRTRLLTLTGTGGSGKTRLALRVAEMLVIEYPDGIWFTDLATLSDSALVLQETATSLGVREEPGRSYLDTLVNYLAPRKLLLLLDNCEHLIDACAQMVEHLLHTCPHLQILATSREPLKIEGEAVWRTPSLSLPALGAFMTAEHMREYEAVELFLERAKFSNPVFSLTDRNAHLITQLCQRLDGIPLALELAAARTRVLSIEQITQRLDARFDLLTTGSRTALPRQQTLRAAMDWSYGLLSQKEATLLRRVSIFAGGWALEAAEGICTDSSLIEARDILDLLSALVDKSLVIAEPLVEIPRYHLLETIRQYSLERLRETGDEAEVRRQHRDWYLDFAEEAAKHLRGEDQSAWLQRLETEHGNLRVALEWSLEQENDASALRLASALWGFWQAHGHLRIGSEALENALAQGNSSSEIRAGALHGAGVLAWQMGDFDRAQSRLEECLAIRREGKDRQGIADILHNMGMVAFRRDPAYSRPLFEESLIIREEIKDELGIADSRVWLGHVALVAGDFVTAYVHYETSRTIYRRHKDLTNLASAQHGLALTAQNQGQYAEARALYQLNLTVFRELGNLSSIAATLCNLGNIAREEGDNAAALPLLTECITLNRDLGDRFALAGALCNLGAISINLGNIETAYNYLEESLVLYREIGSPENVVAVWTECAHLALAQGDALRAAHLIGAIERALEYGAYLDLVDRRDFDRATASASATLDVSEFDVARAEGRIMSPEQVDYCAIETYKIVE